MHLWFALGTAEAYLSIPRTPWYPEEEIPSIYKHRKRNLFHEHVPDTMQSPTSPTPVAVALARKQNSSQASRPDCLPEIAHHIPDTQLSHLILQPSRSPYENNSSEWTGYPNHTLPLTTRSFEPAAYVPERSDLS